MINQLQNLLRKILRRPFYNGQDRLFNFFFHKNLLDAGICTVTPLTSDFKINCDTKTWIGARVYYMGDYEGALKNIFKQIINKGDTILDVGANIGFHSLYFSELTGSAGKVISFEPIRQNYEALKKNLALNDFSNIRAENIALSDKNESLKIKADPESKNPGAFNLFDIGGTEEVTCRIGDEIIKELGLKRIDFIKIDVEGYESFVLNGLAAAISRFRPSVIFEYSRELQSRAGEDSRAVFTPLKNLGYKFFLVTLKGPVLYNEDKCEKTGNILALPG